MLSLSTRKPHVRLLVTAALAGAVGLPSSAAAQGASTGTTPAAATSPAAGVPTAPQPGKAAAGARPRQLDPGVALLMRKQARLLPTANALINAAAAKGSDLAGVSLDVRAGRIDVYSTSAHKPLPVAVPAALKGAISVHRARYTASQLRAAAQRVQSQAKDLAARGVRVAAVNPRLDGSGLDVTVLAKGVKPTSNVAAARGPAAISASGALERLRTDFPGVIAHVRTTSKVATSAGEYYAGWRFNDYAPWYGGDRIAEGCTTGFPAVYQGVLQVMTAAHCGGPGTVFHNGPTASGGATTMGAVTYWNKDTDISAVGVSRATNWINVGPAQNSSVAPVASWEHPVVGEYLCQSGSYTGERCGLRVVDTNQTQCISWFLWWCTEYQGPMADAINSGGSGVYSAGHGDSGAPVYWYDGNGYVHGVGQVHGQLFPNAQNAYPAYVPDTMWCPAPEGWMQRCSSGFSFAHLPGM